MCLKCATPGEHIIRFLHLFLVLNHPRFMSLTHVIRAGVSVAGA